jgi:hypothetical protein
VREEEAAGGVQYAATASPSYYAYLLLRHQAPPQLPAPGSLPAPPRAGSAAAPPAGATRSSRPTSSPGRSLGEKPLVPCVYLLPTLSFRIRCLGPEMGALVVMVSSIQSAD